MTRQSHDQFAKEYLEELLTPLGTFRFIREDGKNSMFN
jgi:hypothetical protein